MTKFYRPFPPLSPQARESSLRQNLAGRPKMAGVWLFAYGSLMWNPGFSPSKSTPARLRGWRRKFCVWTTLARGNLEQPGLALGLMPDGTTDGLAFYIDEPELMEILPKLWEREMWTDVYQPNWLVVDLAGTETITLTFTVNTASHQFAGDLEMIEQAEIIAAAAGQRGLCRDYLNMTMDQLASLGIVEPDLQALQSAVHKQAQTKPA